MAEYHFLCSVIPQHQKRSRLWRCGSHFQSRPHPIAGTIRSEPGDGYTFTIKGLNCRNGCLHATPQIIHYSTNVFFKHTAWGECCWHIYTHRIRWILITLTHDRGRGLQDDLVEFYLLALEPKPCIIHFICLFSEFFETAPHFFLWMYPTLLQFWGTCEGVPF